MVFAFGGMLKPLWILAIFNGVLGGKWSLNMKNKKDNIANKNVILITVLFFIYIEFILGCD